MGLWFRSPLLEGRPALLCKRQGGPTPWTQGGRRSPSSPALGFQSAAKRPNPREPVLGPEAPRAAFSLLPLPASPAEAQPQGHARLGGRGARLSTTPSASTTAPAAAGGPCRAEGAPHAQVAGKARPSPSRVTHTRGLPSGKDSPENPQRASIALCECPRPRGRHGDS